MKFMMRSSISTPAKTTQKQVDPSTTTTTSRIHTTSIDNKSSLNIDNNTDSNELLINQLSGQPSPHYITTRRSFGNFNKTIDSINSSIHSNIQQTPDKPSKLNDGSTDGVTWSGMQRGKKNKSAPSTPYNHNSNKNNNNKHNNNKKHKNNIQ